MSMIDGEYQDFKLGKLPARPNSIPLKMAMYFDRSKLPEPPLVMSAYKALTPWSMLANDQYGSCVWTGAAHETRLWHHEGRKPAAVFNDDAVLTNYEEGTGYFHRDQPNTDMGTDMQKAAEYRRTTGLLDAKGERHKIEAYVAPAKGSVHDLALGIHLFGAVGVGIMFTKEARTQMEKGEPWDYVSHASELGGHYVPVVGRNSAGNFVCITWGRPQAMTPHYFQNMNDESVCYLSEDRIRHISPEGFDLSELQRDLRAFGSSALGA